MMQLRWLAKHGQLTFTERLLQQLGYPDQLVVERVGSTGLIIYVPGWKFGSPGATVRKVNYPRRSSPRLGIGTDPAKALNLINGRYRAEISGTIIIATYDD